MDLTDQEKKQIIESLIETISHAADKEYQRRVWIEGRGPECEDFDDFADIIIHENGALLKEHKSFGITKKQYSLLMDFQRQLKTFSRGIGRDHLPRDFIDTQEWEGIVELSKEILHAFSFKKDDFSKDSE